MEYRVRKTKELYREYYVPEYKLPEMLSWRGCTHNFDTHGNALLQIDIWKRADENRITSNFVSDEIIEAK